MALFAPLFGALEGAGARYVVIGGVAVVLHGYTRFTQGLDLVLDPEPEGARRAMGALVSRGLRPVVPVDPLDFANPALRRQWAEQRNMVVFSLRDPDNPLLLVDVLLESPVAFDGLYSRSTVVSFQSVRVRVASLDDLIQLKRIAGRNRDMDDIRELEEIRKLLEGEQGT